MTDLNLDGLTDAQLRLFAVRCARRVQHLMTDPRSVAALDVAERYTRGEATDAELEEAWTAADAADAAWAASWAASPDAARAAARGAARAAAADAARAAARGAAGGAWAASYAAAADAASEAERAEQQKILDEVRNMK